MAEILANTNICVIFRVPAPRGRFPRSYEADRRHRRRGRDTALALFFVLLLTASSLVTIASIKTLEALYRKTLVMRRPKYATPD